MTLNLTAPDDTMPRKAPLIPLANLRLQNAGVVWKEYLIRLPDGFVADDLKETNVWSQIQGGKGLVKHDRVYCVAYDESWVAEAIVADADGRKVVLAKPKLTHFPDRFTKLLETELFKIEWNGAGYCVVRKSDGSRMGSPVSSIALAERELAALHRDV